MGLKLLHMVHVENRETKSLANATQIAGNAEKQRWVDCPLKIMRSLTNTVATTLKIT